MSSKEIKKRNKRVKITIVLLLFMLLYIGYAMLSQDLNVNGTSKINNSTWDIHFDNIKVSGGSVQINEDDNDSAATINSSDNTIINYSVTLNQPGDFYEFTVDAKNFGTIDGVVEKLKTTININNGTPIDVTENPSSLPKYLLYSVTYANGDKILANQELKSEEKTTYKVRIEYNTNLDPSDLPGEVKNIGINIDTDYLQSGDTVSNDLVDYQVIHRYQNSDGTYRDVVENLKGKPDVVFSPSLKEEAGFENPELQEVILKADGTSVITYVYSVKKVSLTLENSNYIETETPSGEYDYGTSITLRAKEVEYREFIKWSNNETEEEITFVLTEDITISPIYEITRYTVTFDANGGEVNISSKVVSPNEKIGTLPIPLKDNKTFEGWFTEPSGGIEIKSDYIVKNDIKLYAKYKVDYECSFDGEVTKGTEYINGQYIYKYGYTKSGDSWVKQYLDYDEEEGWGVDLLDPNSTDPINSPMCVKINNYPVVSMNYTYYNSKSNNIDLSQVKTTYIHSMDAMFRDTHFNSIDFSKLDTRNVNSMNRMLNNINMDYVDLSDLNIENVESLSYILNDNNIKKLTIDNWNINTYLFDSIDCTFGNDAVDQPIIKEISAKNIKLPYETDRLFEIPSLEKIDLTGMTVDEDCTSIVGLFKNATSLKTVVGMDTWNIPYVDNISNLFENCKSLVELDLSAFNSEYLYDISNMLSGCESLQKIDLTGFNLLNIDSFYGFADGVSSEVEVILDNWVIDSNSGYYNLFDAFPTAKKISLRNWKLPEDASSMLKFEGTNNLVELNVSGWDLSETTNVSYLFKSNKKLERIIGLDTWDTSNITDMSYMFSELSNLKTINGIREWDTSNVTTMYQMFYNSGLEEISLNGLETNSLEDASEMFSNCNSIKKLDLTNFNLSYVANKSSFFNSSSEDVEVIINNWDMSNYVSLYTEGSPWTTPLYEYLMFEGTLTARNLILPENFSYFFYESEYKYIDVTGWDLSSVTNLSHLFDQCNYLEGIIGLYTWDTSNITNMEYMFKECYELTSIDLSDFDTSSVESMAHMFESCSNIKTIDISSFSTESLINTENMFYDCSSLETIYASELFDNTNITSSDYMFYSENIVGGAGTIYDYDYTNKEYARLDEGIDNPGYFSRREGIKVTFNPNGGILLQTNKYYPTSGEVGELPVPTKRNAIFEGWYTNLVNGLLVEEDTLVTEDTTFFAKWKNSIGIAEISNRVITLNKDENESIIISNSANIDEGYTFTSSDNNIATVDSTGKVIAVSEGETSILITGTTSNAVVKVTIIVAGETPASDTFTITYNVNGGSLSHSMKKIPKGSNIGQLANPTRQYYIFDGWYTSLVDGVVIDSDYIPTKDITLYAKWIDDTKYTVTFNPNGGTVDEETRDVHEGDNIGNLPYPIKEGKVFVGWYTDITNGIKIDKTIKVNNTMVLYARWKDSVELSDLPVGISLKVGNTRQLEATNPEYYEEFKYDSLDEKVATIDDDGLVTATGLGATTILVTGKYSENLRYVNVYVIEDETESYTLTFNANGGSVNETTRTVYKNYSVGTLPTPTKENSYFGGWKDSNNNYYTSITTASESTTLYAVWNDTDYVARIGSTYYTDLQQAAIDNTGEVVILRDLFANISIPIYGYRGTINFDRHTLIGYISTEGSPAPIISLLAGRIKHNGGIGANGTIYFGSSNKKIDDGMIVHSHNNDDDVVSLGFSYSGRLIMYKGLIDVPNGIAISLGNSDSLIYGGTIRAKTATGRGSSGKNIIIYDGRIETTDAMFYSSFEIRDGTLEMNIPDSKTGDVSLANFYRVNAIIKGGTINIKAKNAYVGLCGDIKDTGSISGGTINITSTNSGVYGFVNYYDNPISISGGTITLNGKTGATFIHSDNAIFSNADLTITSSEGKAIAFMADTINMNSGSIKLKGNNPSNSIFSYLSGATINTPSGKSLLNRNIANDYIEYYVQ